MLKWILAAMLPLSLHAQTAQRTATDAEIAAIKTGSATSLKDADSAIFRDVVANEDGKGHAHYCGLVNARNSFGGYAGFTRFYGTGNLNEAPILAGVMFTDDGNVPGMASQMCASNGLN